MGRQPRSSGKRITLMLLLVLAGSLLGGSLGLIEVRFHVAGHTIGTHRELALLVLLVVYAFLATKVSLRWYYALWLLVPLIGVYAFWKISWRVVYLPWRDWDLRPGESVGAYDVPPRVRQFASESTVKPG